MQTKPLNNVAIGNRLVPLPIHPATVALPPSRDGQFSPVNSEPITLQIVETVGEAVEIETLHITINPDRGVVVKGGEDCDAESTSLIVGEEDADVPRRASTASCTFVVDL